MTLALTSLIAKALQPLTVAFALAVVGTWRRHRGPSLLIAAVAVILVFGYRPVPDLLQRSLAARSTHVVTPRPDITNILVLASGGFAREPDMPVNSRAEREYLYRFIEGVRLHRAIPGSRLIVSVSSPGDPVQAREVLDRLGAVAGLAPAALVPVAGSSNTRDEAGRSAALVGTGEFYLVTSDVHMPRALMLFRRQGLAPVPAPVGLCGSERGEARFDGHLYPDVANLAKTDQVLHEYLGMVWAWLSGPFGGP